MSAQSAAGEHESERTPESPNSERLDAYREFLAEEYSEEIREQAQSEERPQVLRISWQDLDDYDSDIADEYLSRFDSEHDYLEEAFGSCLAEYGECGNHHVRVRGLPKNSTFSVGDERASEVEDLVAMRGQITKRSDVDPKIEEAAFECQRCGTLTYYPQDFGILQEPRECKGCEGQGPFWINNHQSEFTDYQKLRLRQRPEEMSDGETAMLPVHAVDDLTGEVEVGKRVTVVAQLVSKPKKIGQKKSTVFDTFLDANEIIVENDANIELEDEEHREAVEELKNDPKAIPKMVASVATHHEGDPHLKEAVLLQIVRGNDPTGADGKDYRGTIHILMLGDPGSGKSDFLDAVMTLAPISESENAKSASEAGLTAAITRDSWTEQEFTITAGSLPKASGGVAAIDEIDEISPTEQGALLVPLSEGVVKITKAGQKATLQADTCLLAAGNPTQNKYDREKSIMEQTNLDSALLDRMDLIYTPKEKTDRETVESIAEHIVTARNAATKQERGLELSEEERDSTEPLIDHEVLQQYLAEARQLEPVIKDSAVKDALRDWYVEQKMNLVRHEDESEESIPMTPRSQHAIVRLAEASAKLRYSEEIEMVDVQRVIRRKARSLREIGVDEDLIVSPDDSESSGSMTGSNSEIVRKLVGQLKTAGGEYGADPEKVVDQATEQGIPPDVAEELLEELEADDEIYEVGNGRLALA